MEDGRQTNGPLGKNLRAAGEGLLVFLKAMGVASPDPTHLDASTALCVFFSAMGRGALPAIAALKAEREILTRERRDLEEDRRRLMIEKSGRSAQTAEMMVRSQSLFYDLEKKIVDDLEKKIETIWSPVRLSDTWQPWQPDETGNRDKLKDNVPVNYIDRSSSSSSYSDAETKPDSSSNNDDISDDKKTKPAKKGSPRTPSPGRAAALLSSFSSSSTSNSDSGDSNDRLDDEKATVAATIITPPTVRDKQQRGGENGAQSMNKATPFDDGFWGEMAGLKNFPHRKTKRKRKLDENYI